MKKMLTTEKWNEFWLNKGYTLQSFEICRYVSLSARSKKIETRIQKYFGFFKGLDVIELGSGIGTQSLLIGLKGAKVTLVDFSNVALQKAREFFSEFGLSPTCCRFDILDLDSDFFGKFDISMSFGTVEHFFNSVERKKAIDIHFKVLKKGGISFISVPNKFCPHYRIFSKLVRMIRREISEKPFDSNELRKYVKGVGYRHCEVFGSSLLEFDYLIPYFYAPVQIQISSPFDDCFAHALTVFAIK